MKFLFLSLTVLLNANFGFAQSQGESFMVSEAREMLNQAYGTSNFVEIARGMLQTSYGRTPDRSSLEELAKTCRDDSEAGLFCWFVPCSDTFRSIQTLRDNEYLVLSVDKNKSDQGFCEVRYARPVSP